MLVNLLIAIAIWYLISQALAWLVCHDVSDVDQVVTVGAGFFIAPALLALLLLTWLSWSCYVAMYEINKNHLMGFFPMTKPSEHWLDEL